jgi:protoporphyrinogen oxidase
LEERFSTDFIEKFAIPFFAGVFLDRSLDVSANRLQWVWKMLAEGDTVLPLEGIEAVAKGVAKGITAGSVRTHAPVDSISRSGGKWQVHLRSSEVLEAEVVIVATDVTTASRLTKGNFDTEMFGSTCLYFEAPEEPLTEPYLLLNGMKAPGIVNHMAPLTKVQPGYRLSAGRGALVSVNILGVPEEPDAALAEVAKKEIAPWLPEAKVAEWQFLRAYRIPNAQLAHRPGYAKRQPKMVYDDGGLLLAGEYVQNSSIDGAIESGVRAAKKALERV